jgi:hypothetical protein
MQDAFAPLDGHSEFLRMTLKNRSAVLFVRDALPKHFVAVHVRRGDFHEPTGRPTPGVSNQRIEIGWYVRAVRAVLKELGATRVMVFSDGTNEELAPLLALDEVKRAERNNALIDILRISHATALVASGSTFSAWGAFLGSVPTIHHPGQHLYLTRPLGTAADIDWDAELPLSDVFLEYLKRRMEEEV